MNVRHASKTRFPWAPSEKGGLMQDYQSEPMTINRVKKSFFETRRRL